ncbi:unnamed protein product [Brassica oleracea var. botrytis]
MGENRRTRSRPRVPTSPHCSYYLEKKEGFITRKERKILVGN